MSITRTQSYKEVMQLALRTEKLTGERMYRTNFQKRKGFNFVFGQSSKKSRSFDSFGNSSGSGLVQSVFSNFFDLLNHLSLVCHYQALLLEVE